MQNLETAVGRNDDVSALRVRQNKEVGVTRRRREALPSSRPVRPSLTTQEDSEDYVPAVLSSGSSVRISVCPPTNRGAFAGDEVRANRSGTSGGLPPSCHIISLPLSLSPSASHEGPRGQPVDTLRPRDDEDDDDDKTDLPLIEKRGRHSLFAP